MVFALGAPMLEEDLMIDYEYEIESQCPDGGHDFEPQPVPGGFGIVVGESRCWACGTLASDFNIELRVVVRNQGPANERGQDATA